MYEWNDALKPTCLRRLSNVNVICFDDFDVYIQNRRNIKGPCGSTVPSFYLHTAQREASDRFWEEHFQNNSASRPNFKHLHESLFCAAGSTVNTVSARTYLHLSWYPPDPEPLPQAGQLNTGDVV